MQENLPIMMNWKQLITNKRFGQESRHEERKDDRNEFHRDYDRLIFSAPFRRLQNKTQVFPLPGSVFVHNRLTHSLEVASVGRSLGNNCAERLLQKHPELKDSHFSEISYIVTAACLAHDMGNPPFGHSGERAISTYFSEREGKALKAELTDEQWNDLIHYEGNANAFRLLTHQFKGRRPGGFVMTYSTLASIVKYPFSSSATTKNGKFGFFESEKDDYVKIAEELGIIKMSKEGEPLKFARHPLVYLVEAADDICYEIMDLEDAHKLKLLSTEETQELLFNFFDENEKAKIRERFEEVTDTNEQIVYLRACVISLLTSACTDVFVNNEEKILSGTFEGCLLKHISERPRQAYEQCQKVAFAKIYRCKDVVDIELAGFKIISTLIQLLIEAEMHPDKAYSKILLGRISEQYSIDSDNVYDKIMTVLDYISGMTDVFALDLYRKINGNSLPMV